MKTKRYLIADDDAEFRDLMSEIILNKHSEEKVILLQAENGEEAIKHFEESMATGEFVDIVITDFIMPKATGSDVIEFIIQNHPVPIIVVSAFPEALSHDFIQEGAVSFLRKPFTIEAAQEALDAANDLKIFPKDIQQAWDAIEKLKNLNL